MNLFKTVIAGETFHHDLLLVAVVTLARGGRPRSPSFFASGPVP
jgi:hypothetical protein